MRMMEVTFCIAVFVVSAAAQTVTGSGAAGNVPLFTGTSTIGSSVITQSGGNIGIGTANPTSPLQVAGIIVANTFDQIATDTFVETFITPQGASASYTLSNYGLAWKDYSGNTTGASAILSGWGGVNLYTSGTRRMTIGGAGNVGIGTTTPGAKLEVDGNVKLTSGSGASITYADGTVQSTAYTGVSCGGDYAESVDVAGVRTSYEPGDVLVIDPNTEGHFLKSAEAYSTSVTGIYSTKPGFTGRRQTTDRSHMKDEVPMAMVGIVPTKVSAENGAIKPGDLLVSSSKPGYAMKGTDRSRMLGAVIGKALGHLDSGTGVIEVVATLQ